MNGLIVLQRMLVLLAMMLTGFFCYKKGILDKSSCDHISKLAINVMNPLLILDGVIGKGGGKLAKLFPGGIGDSDNSLLVTAIVLFCASGTGIYGSIVSGMNGDHSILLAKSILDLFTAMIFACSLGMAVSAIALPQLIVFLALFLCARLLFPLTTPTMIDDFKACGGLIMIATGFRIAKMEEFPVADMIPAMILIWPLSWLWTNWVIPML